jgi:hypothetical protein
MALTDTWLAMRPVWCSCPTHHGGAPRPHGPAGDHQGRYRYLPVALGAVEAPLVGEAVGTVGTPGVA